MAHSPSLAFQHTLVGCLITAESQLEGLTNPPSQIDKFLKLKMLAPPINLPFESEFAPGLLPITDRRKYVTGTGGMIGPKIHHYWLPRGKKVESLRFRHKAIGASEILSECKKCAVWSEVLYGLWSLVVEVNFNFDRVGF